MCGIVAAVAARNIVPVLIEGPDEAGVPRLRLGRPGLLNPTLTRLRSVGRVAELAAQAEGQVAHHGIAHTRWATHGVPSERNAHPHVSAGLAVVHNGIIENYAELKQELMAAGYAFTSDTDTEVIAHLIRHTSNRRPTCSRPCAWPRRADRRLCDRRAAGVGRPHRRRPPRRAPVAGVGRGRQLRRLRRLGPAAGDAAHDLPRRRRCRRTPPRRRANSRRRRHGGKRPGGRPVHESTLSADDVELGDYTHYMQKEIFEQPQALAATLEMIGGAHTLSPNLFGVAAPEMLPA
jgi:glucosamine--fructose-6-phosphate aminotransferase (isomerizing)